MRWFLFLIFLWACVISQGETISFIDAKISPVFYVIGGPTRTDDTTVEYTISVERKCSFEDVYFVSQIGKVKFKRDLNFELIEVENNTYKLQVSGFSLILNIGQINVVNECHSFWDTHTILQY